MSSVHFNQVSLTKKMHVIIINSFVSFGLFLEGFVDTVHPFKCTARLKSSSISCVFQSAAALCVGVGSFSDPGDLPGLAHFLEHSE